MRSMRLRPRPRRRAAWLVTLPVLLMLPGCVPGRAVAVGPIPDASGAARSAAAATRLADPARIEFRWELNESGSRVDGIGIARIEPPFRARLDLFLDNGEGVVSAALVDDDLRLPPGAPDDVLPPVELMWGTLGVFRPLASARLVEGQELDDGGRRFRYTTSGGDEIHYDVVDDRVRSVELLDGSSVVQRVRLTAAEDGGYPQAATYRNLVDFRELKITRTAVIAAEPFDPSIWNPGGQ